MRNEEVDARPLGPQREPPHPSWGGLSSGREGMEAALSGLRSVLPHRGQRSGSTGLPWPKLEHDPLGMALWPPVGDRLQGQGGTGCGFAKTSALAGKG